MLGLIGWTKAVGFSLFCFFVVLFTQAKSLSAQQEGFVSIQCCAPSSFIDPNTKVKWTSDNGLQNRGNCRKISTQKVNDSSYKLARFFNTGNRWCYNLDTVNDHRYLLRATFMHDNFQTQPGTFFDVSLGATIISRVDSSVDFLEVENIFSATNDDMNFCIVRRLGNPYISKLELRLLSDLEYSVSDSSSLTKVVVRVDVGNTEGLIRYPYDLNDRIWNVNASQIENATRISNYNIGVVGANTTIPLEVLQTAVTSEDRIDFSCDGRSEESANYLVYLYFLELNVSVGIGQRVFDIYVNGEQQPGSFEILGNNGSLNYRQVVLNVTANRVLNVSLIKVDGALFGPILNAYEILQVQTWVAGTLQTDGNLPIPSPSFPRVWGGERISSPFFP